MDELKLVIELEKELMRDETRQSQVRLNELLHNDFQEYSQSGYAYGKQYVLDAFQEYQPGAKRYESKNFTARYLDNNLVQVNFESFTIPRNQTEPRAALRSSLWKKEGNHWQMIFHQGTLKADDAE
ncbi:MAG: DUF4440 domain-containing protein [Alphaproteobacteria bacterium]|nr:DUF4440 domain-containing protein [Alphaproteobacteria bacterium]